MIVAAAARTPYAGGPVGAKGMKQCMRCLRPPIAVVLRDMLGCIIERRGFGGWRY